MRNNAPVTQSEYMLKDGETIVSKTDLHGIITYVNDDFCKISGFAREELIGSPQSIVRHPDMPSEAFADFWRTLKAGKAWTGLVKNRCKNGDHYWVEANAAPMLEHGKVVGYTSIRVKPARDQVTAAEHAYRAIRNGNASIEIVEGNVVKRTFLRHYAVSNRLSLRSRMMLSWGVIALLFAIDMQFAVNSRYNAWLQAAASAVGIGLCFLFAHLIYRAAILPMERIRQDVERMSAGDLTGRISADGNDEIAWLAQALRVLQINVKLLVGQIKEATDVVHLGAAEIATGNADLAGRTESQASALEETASSMEELTSTVKQNADNADEANQLAATASEVALKGGAIVSEVVGTMEAIQESSTKIAEIIGVINSIAFQTNILALNAAVEAAHAGEQGRGFAVVASEVRNLAQRSALAAQEIDSLIANSVERVAVGSKLVDDAGKTMDQIVTSVRQVSAYMADITLASREQSEGIALVNHAIIQMDETTQQNAAMVEQAAAAAVNMHDQAIKLAQVVNTFKLVSGSGYRQMQGTHFRKSQLSAVPAAPSVAGVAYRGKRIETATAPGA